MISLLKDHIQKFEEFKILQREVEVNCEKMMSTVRANGVVLEELKNNNYNNLTDQKNFW